MAVSHAVNHLFHFPIVSDRFLSIPLFPWRPTHPRWDWIPPVVVFTVTADRHYIRSLCRSPRCIWGVDDTDASDIDCGRRQGLIG